MQNGPGREHATGRKTRDTERNRASRTRQLATSTPGIALCQSLSYLAPTRAHARKPQSLTSSRLSLMWPRAYMQITPSMR